METDTPSSPDRRPRPRWPARLIAALAVLLAAAVPAVKYWIAPWVIREEFRRQLPEYWAGTGTIEDVEFAFFGPVALRGVTLFDTAGRAWIEAADATMHLRDWPGLEPKVRSVEVAWKKVAFHADADGRFRPPWRKVPAELWRKYLDLRHIELRGGPVVVRRPGQSQTVVESLAAGLDWDPDARRAAVRAPWGREIVFEDVRTEGFVLRPDRLAVSRLTGRLGDGWTLLGFDSRMGADGLWRGEGQVALLNLDLERVGLPVAGFGKGTTSGQVSFRLADWDANGLTGSGWSLLRGADLRGVPAVEAAVGQARMGNSATLAKADMDATFRVRGSRFVTETVRMRFPLGAVDVEPGGSLDFLTGRLDVTVVMLPFEKARNLLKSIPMVGLMVGLTEQLTRLRIHGPWQDAAALKAEPAALSGVTNETRRFLLDAARGRQRAFGPMGGLEALFGAVSGSAGPASRPASAPGTDTPRP